MDILELMLDAVLELETETRHHQQLHSAFAVTSVHKVIRISESTLIGTVIYRTVKNRDSIHTRHGLLHGWIPLIETKFLFQSPATDHAAEGP